MNLLKLIKEYLRRILRNYKIYSITILGMSIAIIASFYIYFYVTEEYSYNAFHENKKDIYRIINKPDPKTNHISAQTFGQLLEPALNNLSYIKNGTHLKQVSLKVKLNKQEVNASFSFVDPSFFKIFNFELLKGNIEDFNNTQNAVLLTEKKALELFNNKNPIGRIFYYPSDDNSILHEFVVVGVLKNIPKFSTIQGAFFAKFSYYDKIASKYRGRSSELYLEIPNYTSENKITNDLSKIAFDNKAGWSGGSQDKNFKNYYNLQRLDKIYLNSNNIKDQLIKGNKQILWIFMIVGMVTLFLALTNYVIMNLGIKINRVKEFKTKVILGSTKKHIFIQLAIESIINFTICYAIVLISSPYLDTFISSILGFDYFFNFNDDSSFIILFYTLLVVVAIATALLEFILLFKQVFNDNYTITKATLFGLKNTIIIVQIIILLTSLSSAFMIYKQVNYLQNKDLGFNLKKVYTIPILSHYFYDKAFLDELKTISYITNLSLGEQLFSLDNNHLLGEYQIVKNNNHIDAYTVQGDENYLKTNGIQIISGRNINKETIPAFNNYLKEMRNNKNSLKEVLVNETFVKKANLKTPIGTVVKHFGLDYVIVGVFKDVNFAPLYYPVEPLVYGFNFYRFPTSVLVTIDENKREVFFSFLKDYFKKYNLEEQYEKSFEKTYKKGFYEIVYKKELQLKNLLIFFTVIVLIIAALGLIAISLFITQNRTKEIGIRKINGATTLEILKMLNKSFVFWVGIAFVFAVPISYIVMQKWLQNFAFKTGLSWWIFALAGLVVLLIALLAVSWQTYKAATNNPVKALRDD